MEKIEILPADKYTAENYLKTIFGDGEPLKAGTIYTLTRKVSSSGMTRYVSAYAIRNGDLVNLTYQIAAVTGFKAYNFEGYTVIKLGGVGMDLHDHLAYNLSLELYGAGNGYVISKRTI
jgi:hypothetical protein